MNKELRKYVIKQYKWFFGWKRFFRLQYYQVIFWKTPGSLLFFAIYKTYEIEEIFK